MDGEKRSIEEIMADHDKRLKELERKEELYKAQLKARQLQNVQNMRKISRDVRDLIIGLHNAGRSDSYVTKYLNLEGVPTARGGKKWYVSTVIAVLEQEGIYGWKVVE